ncbi:MAG TPA: hypothetical protein VMI56_22755 [Reyranella sp.]|nr:hypothetical protein [Reyranella sp.]
MPTPTRNLSAERNLEKVRRAYWQVLADANLRDCPSVYVSNAIRDFFDPIGEDDVKRLSLVVIHLLLDQGAIVSEDVWKDGKHLGWRTRSESPAQTLAWLEREWIPSDDPPGGGGICWFDLTPKNGIAIRSDKGHWTGKFDWSPLVGTRIEEVAIGLDDVTLELSGATTILIRHDIVLTRGSETLSHGKRLSEKAACLPSLLGKTIEAATQVERTALVLDIEGGVRLTLLIGPERDDLRESFFIARPTEAFSL